MSVRLEPWESDNGTGYELANLGEHLASQRQSLPLPPHTPDPKCTTAGKSVSGQKIQTV